MRHSIHTWVSKPASWLRAVWITCAIALFPFSFTHAEIREITTTWTDLPSIDFPAMLGNSFYQGIVVDVSEVPDGAYAHLNSYGKCASLCKWSCERSYDNSMRLFIWNAYGYGAKFEPCEQPIAVEFGTVIKGVKKVHCSFSFKAEGDRRLPKIRIGEVIAVADTLIDGLSVQIFPQIEFVYDDGGDTFLWPKPHWSARIEGKGIEAFYVEGWNDCSGPRVQKFARSPCKPNPLFLDKNTTFDGVIKVIFEPDVACYSSNHEMVSFEFESDSLSFWYDLIQKKKIPPR